MKKTKIKLSGLTGDDISVVADYKNMVCEVCGQEDLYGSVRVGDLSLDGDNVVIEWYYLCAIHKSNLSEHLMKEYEKAKALRH